ncbi:restriction endonuclease subunit S [Corynebacterium sp. ACRPQ]|uniref:restriction endonuclease subunit S n=1 Tax=Corynebacterium sp. ACRPQ TaxID=2918201 RepID=UPI001EF1FC90|nr:restriction endonuclease subunit S [Corynebacterium sp. ACRPQ]MCG7440958.1 restriction endonuclease subunit S [Corynebacterium sp. ACRPQ]
MQTIQIADGCSQVTSGATPSRKKPEYFIGDIPWLKTKELNDALIGATEEHISESALAETSCKLIPAGAVVMAMYGATVGKLGILGTPMTTNQACCAMIADEVSLHSQYLFYWLLQNRQSVINLSNGAAQQNLSVRSIKNIALKIPMLEKQIRTAYVLKSLDDKIAANSRIIKIATHLNINLVEKAVTKELEPLQNLADITMGSSPKGEFLNEEGIGEPFFQGVRDFGELFPSERVFAEKAVRTAQEGDILFAVRAPIGEVNIAERPCVIGRGIAAIRGKQSHLGLFYLLKGHPELWETYQSSGTVFAGINKSDLHNAVIPVLRDSEKLEQQLTPIHERAMHALRENQVLARTRDELLPLLMSGRITVGEAQETADAADEATSES